jgi:hypothetical protein
MCCEDEQRTKFFGSTGKKKIWIASAEHGPPRAMHRILPNSSHVVLIRHPGFSLHGVPGYRSQMDIRTSERAFHVRSLDIFPFIFWPLFSMPGSRKQTLVVFLTMIQTIEAGRPSPTSFVWSSFKEP